MQKWATQRKRKREKKAMKQVVKRGEFESWWTQGYRAMRKSENTT